MIKCGSVIIRSNEVRDIFYKTKFIKNKEIFGLSGDPFQLGKMTERVCVAVAELRKKYKDKTIDLRKWLEMDDCVYVGRRGRIFINGEIFHYKDSVWKNDFTVKDHGRDECLELYTEQIVKKIKDGTVNLETIRGKKLGCFCKPGEKCHVDVLIRLLE